MIVTTSACRAFRATTCAASLMLSAAAAGCRSKAESATPKAPTAVVVGPENVAIAKQDEITNGPEISGSLDAALDATIRAQVSGPVLETLVDVGQQVQKGQLLMRIDDSAIREQVLSARAAVTTSQSNLDVAQHNAQRSRTLLQAGAIAQRDLETSENAAAAARAQLENAKALLANAEKQQAYTRVVAPFSGAVSQRQANPGDVVSPGTALITIVDPASMRLEASVPSDQLVAVHLGMSVDFTVRGYPGRTFIGRVTRISPSADPATRQVPVVVTIPNVGRALVAGLFADGRVESERRLATVIPTSAVDERGVRPSVVRLRAGRAERVEVALGVRDAATERVAVTSGIMPGDTVLTGSAIGITVGTPVKVTAPPNDVRSPSVSTAAPAPAR